jgi:hypothetical protein
MVSQAFAHGGGLDSNGGHNCYVDKCAGSYHYHVGPGGADIEFGGLVVIAIFVLMMGYLFWSDYKVQLFKKQQPHTTTDKPKEKSANANDDKAFENLLGPPHPSPVYRKPDKDGQE